MQKWIAYGVAGAILLLVGSVLVGFGPMLIEGSIRMTWLLFTTPITSDNFIPVLFFAAVMPGAPLALIITVFIRYFARRRQERDPAGPDAGTNFRARRPKAGMIFTSIFQGLLVAFILSQFGKGSGPNAIAGLALIGVCAVLLFINLRILFDRRDALVIDAGGLQYRRGGIDVALSWRDIVTIREDQSRGVYYVELMLERPLSAYGRTGALLMNSPRLMIDTGRLDLPHDKITAVLRHHLARQPEPPPAPPIVPLTADAPELPPNTTRLSPALILLCLPGFLLPFASTGYGLFLFHLLIQGEPLIRERPIYYGCIMLLCMIIPFAVWSVFGPPSLRPARLAPERRAVLTAMLARTRRFEAGTSIAKRIAPGLVIVISGATYLAMGSERAFSTPPSIFIFSGAMILAGLCYTLAPLLDRRPRLVMDARSLTLRDHPPVPWADIIAVHEYRTPRNQPALLLKTRSPASASGELSLELGGLTRTPAEIRYAFDRLRAAAKGGGAE